MVVFTVRQLIHDILLGLDPMIHGLRDKRFAEAKIYLVRDGSTVFYIGKSDSDVIERLRTHLGFEFRGRRSRSDLGELIEANIPESESWNVELYTPDECRWAVPDGESYFRISAKLAEWCMIRHFKPCLNIVANRERATVLPKRYKRPASIVN